MCKDAETNPSRYSYKVWVTVERYDKIDDTLCIDIDMPDLLAEFDTPEEALDLISTMRTIGNLEVADWIG